MIPNGWAERYQLDEKSGVAVRRDCSPDFGYSDGEVEDRLLELLRSTPDRSLFSTSLSAAAGEDWATRYHLSPVRANALRPLAGLLRGRTLELGCGCGAITRFLAELGGSVVAVEGSLRRSAITAARCAGLPNVSVICDTLGELPAQGSFDAITLIGVLEWTRAFGAAGRTDPVQATLEKCSSLLAPAGTLLLAIENQLGLKYFAGFVEDHVGLPMHGIEDLYDADSPVTFGRAEILGRLEQAGFAEVDLFLPLPDYKLASTVVTPTGLADPDWLPTLATLLAASVSRDRQPAPLPVFSLEQAWRVVARNGLTADLANSFLLVARRDARARSEQPWDSSVLAFHYGGSRRPELAKETRIRRVGGGEMRVARRRLLAADSGEGPLHEADEPFESGELWSDQLFSIVNRPGWSIEDVARWAKPWLTTLADEAGCRLLASEAVAPRFVDATPFNLVSTEAGPFRFFDLEPLTSERAELGFVLFRGLFHALLRAHSAAPPASSVPRRCRELVQQVASALGLPIADAELERYTEREAALQSAASGEPTSADSLATLRLRVRPRLADVGALAEAARQARPAAAAVQAGRSRLALGLLRRCTPATLRRVLLLLRGGIFDPRFYVARYPDAAADPWLHFLAFGEDEGRDPNALFDSAWYTRQCAHGGEHVARALTHYLGDGQRDPHPLFLTSYYRRQRGQLPAGTTPLGDYLRHGGQAGLSPHALFDRGFYLSHNPDVQAAGIDPLLHFLLHGGLEGRAPHPRFDAAFYLETNPDVRAAGINPLVHYVVHGAAEGRDPSPEFSSRRYRQKHPEVAESGLDPLSHSLLGDVTSGRR